MQQSAYKKIKYLILLFSLLLQASILLAQTGYGSEKELKKKADGFFDKDEFAVALPLYSQLLSIYPKDAEYNFRYGVCNLVAGSDKDKSIVYLTLAAKSEEVDKEVFYYLGRALHLNYRFDEAIANYNIFKTKATAKSLTKLDVNRQIEMCSNGKDLLRSITDLEVIERNEFPLTDYFRAYDLSSIDTKITVKPEEMQTDVDKKKKEESVIVTKNNSQEIYFSSFGDDAKGSRDIYKIVKLPNFTFSKPIKLPAEINTAYDEEFPYITPDGKTFFFCSKGHNSMGGYDIFKSTFDATTGKYSTPINLDFAINTPDDDILYVYDGKSDFAYFSSKRSSASDKVVVYKIKNQRIPGTVALIKGNFFTVDEKTHQAAKITLKNKSGTKIIGAYNVNPKTGDYQFMVRQGETYLFTVESKDYETMSREVAIPVLTELNPIKQKINIKHVADADELTISTEIETNTSPELIQATMAMLRNKANLEVGGPTLQDSEPTQPIATVDNIKKVADSMPNIENATPANENKNIAESPVNNNPTTNNPDSKPTLSDNKNTTPTNGTNPTTNSTDSKPTLSDNKNTTPTNGTNPTTNNTDSKPTLSDNKNTTPTNGTKPTTNNPDSKPTLSDNKNTTTTNGADPIINNTDTKPTLSDNKNTTTTNGADPTTNNTDSKPTLSDNKNTTTTNGADPIINNADTKPTLSDNKTTITDAPIEKTKPLILGNDAPLEKANTKTTVTQNSVKLDKPQIVTEAFAQAKQSEQEAIDFDKKAEEELAKIPEKEEAVKLLDFRINELKELSAKFKNAMQAEITKERVVEMNDEAAVLKKEIADAPQLAADYKAKAEKERSNAIEEKLFANKLEIASNANNNAEFEKLYYSKNAKPAETQTNENVAAATTENVISETNIANKSIDELKQQVTQIDTKISGLKQDETKTNDAQVKNIIEKQISSLNTQKSEIEYVLVTRNGTDVANKQNKNFASTILVVDVASYPDETKATVEKSNQLFSESATLKQQAAESKKKATTITNIALKNAETIKANNLDKEATAKENLAYLGMFDANVALKKKQDEQIVNNQPKSTANSASVETAKNLCKQANDGFAAAETKRNVVKNEPNSKQKTIKLKEIFEAEKLALQQQKRANELLGSTPESKTALTEIAHPNATNEEVLTAFEKSDKFNNYTQLSNESMAIEKQLEPQKVEIDTLKKSAQKDLATASDLRAYAESLKNKTKKESATNAAVIYENSAAKSNTKADEKSKSIVELQGTANAKKQEAENIFTNFETGYKQGGAIVATNGIIEKPNITTTENKTTPEITFVQKVEPKNTLTKEEEYKDIIAQQEKIDNQTKTFYAGIENNKKESKQHADLSKQLNAQVLKEKKADKRLPMIEQSQKEDDAALSKQRDVEIGMNKLTDLQQQAKELQLRKDNLLATMTPVEKADFVYKSNNPNYNPESANRTADLEKRKNDSIAAISATKASKNIKPIDGIDYTNEEIDNLKKTQNYQRYFRAKYDGDSLDFVYQKVFKKVEEYKRQADAKFAEKEQLIADAGEEKDAKKKSEMRKKAKGIDVVANEIIARADSAYDAAQSLAKQIEAADAKLQMVMNKLDNKSADEFPVIYSSLANKPFDKTYEEYERGKIVKTNDTPIAKADNENKVGAVEKSSLAKTENNIAPNNSANNTDNKIVSNNTIVPTTNNKTITNEPKANIVANNANNDFTKQAQNAYTNDIPLDVAIPSGIIFKVQIGAYKRKVAVDAFGGIKPVSGETSRTGMIRYSAGIFKVFNVATDARKQINASGFKDAFVIAFCNGKRIDVNEARRLLANNIDCDGAPLDAQQNNNNAIANENLSDELKEILATQKNLKQTEGLLFTVQVGVYKRLISRKRLFNLDDLYYDTLRTNLIRYTVGVFDDKANATQTKNKIVDIGIKDAFVIPYFNKRYIPMAEADRMIAENRNVLVKKNFVTNTTNISTNENATKNNTKVDASELRFKVQLGVFRKTVPVEIMSKYLKLAVRGIDELKGNDGTTTYSIGNFITQEEANAIKTEAQNLGLNDAFIAPYNNGQKISLEEAKRILENK